MSRTRRLLLALLVLAVAAAVCLRLPPVRLSLGKRGLDEYGDNEWISDWSWQAIGHAGEPEDLDELLVYLDHLADEHDPLSREHVLGVQAVAMIAVRASLEDFLDEVVDMDEELHRAHALSHRLLGARIYAIDGIEADELVGRYDPALADRMVRLVAATPDIGGRTLEWFDAWAPLRRDDVDASLLVLEREGGAHAVSARVLYRRLGAAASAPAAPAPAPAPGP